MSGRRRNSNTVPGIQAQLEVCRRRLAGHGYKQDAKGNDTDERMNENSNPARAWRLMQREAQLSAELSQLLRKREPRKKSS